MRNTPHAALGGCLVALAAVAGLLGCGATPASVEPAPAQPTPVAPTPAVATEPVLERLSLVLHAGPTGSLPDVGLDMLDLGEPARVGRADLHVGDAYFSLPVPGCGQGGGFGWSVEHADPGPAPWARVVRTALLPATDGSDQLPHEIGITGALTAFGHRVTLLQIEPRAGGEVYSTFEASRTDVADGSPQGGDQVVLAPGVAAERHLGEQILVLALGEGELLGCPTVSLTLLDPRSQIVDVRDGETGTVRIFSRLRLGDVTIRWEGVTEGRLVGGGGRTFYEFRGAVGGSAEGPFSCRPDEPCQVSEVLIEPVDIGRGWDPSTFRLRRAPSGSPPP